MEFLTCGYKISLILSKKWNNASLLTFQERFALKLASLFLGKLTNIQCQCRSLSVKCRKQCKAPTNSMRKLTIYIDNAGPRMQVPFGDLHCSNMCALAKNSQEISYLYYYIPLILPNLTIVLC